MARSRRRSANRSGSTSGFLNLATIAKIGSGLLVAAAGTSGVFYTVSNMPSGTRNITENVEVGEFKTDVAMSRKPPLPDDPTGAADRSAQNAVAGNSSGPAGNPAPIPRANPSAAPQGSGLPNNATQAKAQLPKSPASLPPSNILAQNKSNSTSPAQPLPDLLKTPQQLPGALPQANPSKPDNLGQPLAKASSAAADDPLAGLLNKPSPPVNSLAQPLAKAPANTPPALPNATLTPDKPSDPLDRLGSLAAAQRSSQPAPTPSLNPMRPPASPANSTAPTNPSQPNSANNPLAAKAPPTSPPMISNPVGANGLPGMPPTGNPLANLTERSPAGIGDRPDNRSAPPAKDLLATRSQTSSSPSASPGIPRSPASIGIPSPSPSTAMNGTFGGPSRSASNLPGVSVPPNNPTASRSLPTAPSQADRSGFGNSNVAATPASQPRNIQPAPRALTDDQVRPAGYPAAQSGNLASRPVSSLVSDQPGNPSWEIQQNAAIILEKHAPEQIQVNVPTKFVLVVRNVGRVPASQVLIRDRVPRGSRLIQTTPKPDRQDGDLMEWTIDALPPGETMQITTELMPLQAGEIGSVAEVSMTAVASCRARCTEPKLVIEHTAPPTILVGQQVVMNITVRNEGDGPAENVVIRETVPQGLKHQSGTEIENPIGRLLPGQSRNLQLPLQALNAGQIQNTVRVTGDGKLSDNHTVSLQIVAPSLQVDMSGPTRRFLSRQAIHQMQVKNNGTANATNVQMMARLPRGLKYESSSPAGRYDPSRHAVFWAIQQLPSGQAETLSITTLPLAPGEQEIEFQALADLNQPQLVKRTMTVEQLSELFFEIDDLQDPIEVNSETTYVVRVENQGSQVANQVELMATLPPGLLPVNVDGPVEYQIRNAADGSKQIVFAPIAVLNPQAKLAMRIQVKGQQDGDHRIEVQMTSAQRPTAVAKQESTKVYSDLR